MEFPAHKRDKPFTLDGWSSRMWNEYLVFHCAKKNDPMPILQVLVVDMRGRSCALFSPHVACPMSQKALGMSIQILEGAVFSSKKP